ncbi:CASTOR/POLLUX-related putative ion channel [Streptomyces sp. CA-111067]|uniref:CASTOR/POLLUX-related putative ion channel n=1 Tax=Streptomyces sp. CA-111067 TaxID=3240046 RepID=UPI003D96574F
MAARKTDARPRLRYRLRYRFDNVLGHGTTALVGWLTLLCLLVVLPASAGLVWSETGTPDGRRAQLAAVWREVGGTLRLGGAVGPPVYVLLSVLLALVTLLFVSTLVSLLTAGFDRRLAALRLGRSTVIEERHTVLLGWSDQVFPVVSELVVANAGRRRAVVAILSPNDKVGMEDEIHTKVGRTRTTRVICRNGSVTDPALLARVSPHTADAVLVLSHGADTADPGAGGDALVVKTLLALAAAAPDRNRTVVVAAVREARHHLAASLAAGPGAHVLDIDTITARLIAQTARRPGLSLVYAELLSFAGDEFHTVSEPSLVGREFGDALLAYATSSVVGLVRADGGVELNPPPRRVIRAGDRLVVITRDDDSAVPAGEPLVVDESAITGPQPRPPYTERLLLLGWNRRAPMVAALLDAYVGAGSRLDVLAGYGNGDGASDAGAAGTLPATERLRVRFLDGDPARPGTLDGLDVPSYDAVIVLGHDPPGSGGPADREQAVRDPAGTDLATLTTLLHLRALEQTTGRELSVVTELTDDRNRLLAPFRADADFIVSGRLISLLMTQISQNRHLAELFDDLFTAEGNEIHLKPATDYVVPGREVGFATVVESARRQRQCAIGYRLHEQAATGPSFGVRLNPDKRQPVRLGTRDLVIVVAQDPLPARKTL